MPLYLDPSGNSLGTYTCDYSQVDISKAGNYKAYYTFTAIDNEGIKTYYVGRDIIVEPTTTFEDGATYSGIKVIDVEGGSVTINGEDYFYGDVYNVPGDSTMVITGENGYTKTINFTIELTVEGVKNDTAYYTEVVPVISGGEITLDGAPYVSVTPITTKGHHTLIITGANGFSRTINFTIETTIVGIEDGQMYYETLYPNINAENMTLNGVAYNNEPIENCGNYTLTITGTNGYSKTITFVIEIDVLGYYTITVLGADGYRKDIHFIVKPYEVNVEHGKTYNHSVVPTVSNGTLTLNGSPYTSGNKGRQYKDYGIMRKWHRIISIEAADIYKQEQADGIDVGYTLPEKKDDAFRLFKIYLDNSLDLIALEKSYKRICRKKFAFQDKHGNDYTLAVINLKFNYTYKPEEDKPVKIKELREHFYENGFILDGIHYVRYKRSAGSSREGKCLFIDERLYKAMSKWSECGLKSLTDLASWESYKALSLSSIKGMVNIPLDGILFVPDYKSTFTEEVISVELKEGKLVAEQKQTEITNDIWDGESLLDESVFTGSYADKHMLLLRNKFFKSCAFRTKLQKWIKDKNITLDDLKNRGFVTLASGIRQIVMVTTPNSLKYLKFAGGLSERNIRKWSDSASSTFGVVKWDKSTRFFHGKMVQSSYQLLNTLALSEEQAEQLLQPSIDYISLIRKDVDFMRYHFTDAFAREKDDEESQRPDGLAERADVIFTLMHKYPYFDETELYVNFRDDVVRSLKNRLKCGHILLNGTNATLFGNGPELLKYIAGEEVTSELKKGQIRCQRFGNKARLLCARSPHITMGNLYCVENNLDGGIWDYFDLGEIIVCVNAIGENIQQRLNGCDYDSDTMLVTDDKLLVETAEKYENFFKVPVCGIETAGKTEQTLAELDYDTSENKIGEIVNLSQKLNSIIWDRINNGASKESILPIYEDVCKLAVLSGIEIDKAKRTYNNVSVGKELIAIRKKHGRANPTFFKEIDEGKKEYAFYKTAMDYVYALASKIHFRKGRETFADYRPISNHLAYNIGSGNATEYRHKDKIVEIIDGCKAKVNKLYMQLRSADEQEREVIYDTIKDEKAERDRQVSRWLTNENVLILVLRHYERNSASDWRIYAALINHPVFSELMYELFDRFRKKIGEDKNGEYSLYGRKFAKKC